MSGGKGVDAGLPKGGQDQPGVDVLYGRLVQGAETHTPASSGEGRVSGACEDCIMRSFCMCKEYAQFACKFFRAVRTVMLRPTGQGHIAGTIVPVPGAIGAADH